MLDLTPEELRDLSSRVSRTLESKHPKAVLATMALIFELGIEQGRFTRNEVREFLMIINNASSTLLTNEETKCLRKSTL